MYPAPKKEAGNSLPSRVAARLRFDADYLASLLARSLALARLRVVYESFDGAVTAPSDADDTPAAYLAMTP